MAGRTIISSDYHLTNLNQSPFKKCPHENLLPTLEVRAHVVCEVAARKPLYNSCSRRVCVIAYSLVLSP